MEKSFDLERIFEEHRTPFLLGLVGLFLLGVGVLSTVVVSLNRSKPEVEIISSQESESSELLEVVVDVAGAVEKPGVYRLASDSRVNDALLAAGGLSGEADRDWVSRYINLAQSVSDGIKIYIPTVGEKQQADVGATSAVTDTGSVIGLQTQDQVSINMGSAAELDALWGIGEKRAQAIIENRPYSSLDELMTKAGIPKNVFERIKDKISL
jgi:competence protein ComEA